jgi:hypothetical protein
MEENNFRLFFKKGLPKKQIQKRTPDMNNCGNGLLPPPGGAFFESNFFLFFGRKDLVVNKKITNWSLRKNARSRGGFCAKTARRRGVFCPKTAQKGGGF